MTIRFKSCFREGLSVGVSGRWPRKVLICQASEDEPSDIYETSWSINIGLIFCVLFIHN